MHVGRDKVLVREEFLHRGDKLLTRSTNLGNGQVIELFDGGRKLALKGTCTKWTIIFPFDEHSDSFQQTEHIHFGLKGFKADCHTMTFYHKLVFTSKISSKCMTIFFGGDLFSARVDGLFKREVTSLTLTEQYINRADKLHYRQVVYGKPLKRFEPAEKDRLKHIQVRNLIINCYDNPLFIVLDRKSQRDLIVTRLYQLMKTLLNWYFYWMRIK